MSREAQNRIRWHAFRIAVESGESWETAYDYYLYPKTRVELSVITDER